ncbi:MAG: hypothetical protein IT367_17280 [Candidatus Hydrogenedentes bacterium]|nr:hypothetical protein [Candidatus Hydrogenedentota bacterium]
MKNFSMHFTIFIVCALSALAVPGPTEKNGPCVVLAYDDTGDFGPATPGTKTAGWQEALDYCVVNARDLYVKGGFGGRKAIYHIDDTIRFPAAQDFRVDGGVYVINFKGPDPAVDAVRIDSAMNCEYHLGLIVYGGKGAGLRIKPENPVPIDGFPVVIETQINSQGIADPAPFTAGPRDAGTGLVIDASVAGVNYTKMYFASILNFKQCVSIGGERGFYANEFTCEHLHTNAHGSTLITIDRTSNANRFRFGIGVDQGATDVTGIDLYGFRNTLDLASRGDGFAAGKELILRPSSEGNQINVLTQHDVLSMITDEAERPTNQLTWAGPPAPVRTITGDTGTWKYTQRLFPATVTLTQGDAPRVTFRRGEDAIKLASPLGRDIQLSIGDQLVVESQSAPELRVVPLKTE